MVRAYADKDIVHSWLEGDKVGRPILRPIVPQKGDNRTDCCGAQEIGGSYVSFAIRKRTFAVSGVNGREGSTRAVRDGSR